MCSRAGAGHEDPNICLDFPSSSTKLSCICTTRGSEYVMASSQIMSLISAGHLGSPNFVNAITRQVSYTRDVVFFQVGWRFGSSLLARCLFCVSLAHCGRTRCGRSSHQQPRSFALPFLVQSAAEVTRIQVLEPNISVFFIITSLVQYIYGHLTTVPLHVFNLFCSLEIETIETPSLHQRQFLNNFLF